jgi:hypothetical protein
MKSWMDENQLTLSREFSVNYEVPTTLQTFFSEVTSKAPQMAKIIKILEKRLDSLSTATPVDQLEGLLIMPKQLFLEPCTAFFSYFLSSSP